VRRSRPGAPMRSLRVHRSRPRCSGG